MECFNELRNVRDMHCVEELVMCLGDLSGHLSKHIVRCDGVHGGYGA